MQLRTDDYLRPRQKWTEEIVNKEMLRLLSVKPIDNLNLRDWSSIRRINGLIRPKRKDLLIWRIRHEKHNLPRRARKNIAKQFRNYEELVVKKPAERARHLRICELSVQKKDNPFTVNQLLGQIQDLQDKMNSSNNTREFYDPQSASSSGVSHVPSQPLSIPSSRGMISSDSFLPHDTRNSLGTSGNIFESQSARDGPSSAFFERPKNLASSSCGLRKGNTGKFMEHGGGVRREPQSSTIPTPRFTTNHSTWTPTYHTGGTYSQNGTKDIRDTQSRNSISENSRTQWTFDAGKSTSRTKCAQTHPVLPSQCRGSKKWR